ncbi:MAG: MBL fold metallo-hydrolase [bacterium]|nr:MBL fold metallo-hydrolase [bacterium]
MEQWSHEVLPVGQLQMNAVILRSAGTGEAILIDPGEEAARLRVRTEAEGAAPTQMLATHGHFDHVGAGADLQACWDLPLRCHPDDVPFIERLPEIQESWGFPASAVPRLAADLADGTRIPFAGGEIEVRHVPGHSPGHVLFLLPGLAIVGDCLFAGSVGRTDLPGGDFGVLEKSIRERIYTLPDDTVVVCGHGPDTTVGREKATNPFVQPL